tara:strand:- start:72 stop:569 length:498 start_codon:yes stop_codon:yes gene_type:complete
MEPASTIIKRESTDLNDRIQQMDTIFKNLGFGVVFSQWDEDAVRQNYIDQDDNFFGSRASDCSFMINNCNVVLNTLPNRTPPGCIIRREPFVEMLQRLQSLQQKMNRFQQILDGLILNETLTIDTVLDFIIGNQQRQTSELGVVNDTTFIERESLKAKNAFRTNF